FRFRRKDQKSGASSVGQHVRSKPRQERILIEAQCFRGMEMPAGALFRRSARMKNGGSFSWRKSGQFEIFKGGCDNGGNLVRGLNGLGCFVQILTKRPVGSVILELKLKDVEYEPFEFLIALGLANKRANA